MKHVARPGRLPLDRAAHESDQPGRDGQAHPVPRTCACRVSSCSNAWKILTCLSGGMPMPVSVTANRRLTPHLRPGTRRRVLEHHDLAPFCELDGVPHEIDEHLVQATGVAD